jgi:hypothetical protein
MSLLAGILRVEDTTLLTDLDAAEVNDAVNALLARYEQERNAWQNFLVAGETTNFQTLYDMGAIDEGQEVGPDGRPLETRPTGQIETALPIKRIGWATGWNYETFAHMTVDDMERLTASRQGGNARRHLREQFRALMNDTNWTFTDPAHGALTIRRLANDDGTVYPPTYASDAEATDDHYVSSGYAPTAISATNNPFVTLKAEIIEHFTETTSVIAIINPAQQAEITTDLPSFIDADVEGVNQGADTATATAADGENVPGTFIGTDAASGVRVYVSDSGRVPANYIYAQGVGLPRPLERRVHVPATLRGFKLEADEAHYPLFKRTYMDRFWYGVVNRLSAAVMFLDAGAWANPAAYA